MKTFPTMLTGVLLLVATFGLRAEGAQRFQKEFDSVYLQNKALFDSSANSGRGLTYYGFQSVLMGTLSMYEATGDVQYLERVLRWAETMVSRATVVKGRYRSWTGSWDAFPKNGVQTASSLEYLQGSTELARLVRIIRTNDNLNNRYGARATAIFNFVHHNIVSREYAFAKNWHPSTTATSDTGKVFEYYNDKTALFVCVLIDMHRAGASQLEPGVTYHDYAVKLLNRYLTMVSAPKSPRNISQHGAELWSYLTYQKKAWCGGQLACSSDTSHANRWPRMLQAAIQAGSSLRGLKRSATGTTLPQHFTKLARLFSRVMWNQSVTVPKFSNYIDGENYPYRTSPPWMNGAISAGWTFVGAAEPTALIAAEALIGAVLSGQSVNINPSVQFNRAPGALTGLIGNTVFARSRAVKGVVQTPVAPLEFSAQ